MSNLSLISILLYVLVLLGFAGVLWLVTAKSKYELGATIVAFVLLLAAFVLTLTAAPHVWRNL